MLEAYISHIVTDQGNGGAFCSNCSQTISEILQEKWHQEALEAVSSQRGIQHFPDHMVCPGCGAHLADGGVSVQIGGSDF